MRTFVVFIAVVLLGIILGRLALERTGAGLVALAILTPILFVVLAATLDVGRAALLLGSFLITVLLVRIIILESGWVTLLLAPVVAFTAYVLANVIKVMAEKRGEGEP